LQTVLIKQEVEEVHKYNTTFILISTDSIFCDNVVKMKVVKVIFRGE